MVELAYFSKIIEQMFNQYLIREEKRYSPFFSQKMFTTRKVYKYLSQQTKNYVADLKIIDPQNNSQKIQQARFRKFQ